MLRRGSICYIRLTNVICAIKVTLFSQHFNDIGVIPILWMTNLRNRLKLKSCCPPIWPAELSLGHHFPSYPALCLKVELLLNHAAVVRVQSPPPRKSKEQ